jgi:hypothetical protein
MSTKKSKLNLDRLFFITDDDGGPENHGWRFRRKLIFASYRLASAMIVFGAVSVFFDQFGVGATLVTGGVSLISIITSAYVLGATWDDRKKKNEPEA